MKERWKNIRGYEGYYMISNMGRVFSNRRGIIMPGGNSRGYPQALLSVEGVKKSFLTHRIVELHFVKGYKKGLEINHKDRNRTNNNYKNLEWVTKLENMRHSFKVGTRNHAGGNPKIKVTQWKPITTWKKIAEYNSLSEAAKKTGIDITQISKCVLKKHKTAGGFKWI